MNRLLFACLVVSLELSEGSWSPEVGNSTFEPSVTILEQWTALNERNEKVMKKPDRYIVNRPVKGPPQQEEQQNGNIAQNKVSETDLFLLGAIEKLAHKMEYLEKRVARTEEMLYRFISGSQFSDKQEPCPEQFQRHGGNCYYISDKQMNWKSASSICRRLSATLVEFEIAEEEKSLVDSLMANPSHQGKDFWTGGLNPGLLWIWSNSAKPILSNSTRADDRKNIDGNGRCLLLKYQPLTKTYVYRGTDCSFRNYYICAFLENSVERKLERLQRQLRSHNETVKT